jgi:hypothetical protein
VPLQMLAMLLPLAKPLPLVLLDNRTAQANT